MSSPANNIRSRVKLGFREITRVKEEIEMKMRMPMTSVKDLVSRRRGIKCTGMAMRGLAAIALMMAGTGAYFGMVNGLEGNPTSGNSSTDRGWQRSYLPGIDRLDDQIAAQLEAGNPEYQVFLTDSVAAEPDVLAGPGKPGQAMLEPGREAAPVAEDRDPADTR